MNVREYYYHAFEQRTLRWRRKDAFFFWCGSGGLVVLLILQLGSIQYDDIICSSYLAQLRKGMSLHST